MKLSITLPEAQEGHKRGRFGRKWDEIKTSIGKPVALTRPLEIDGKEYHLLRIRECTEQADGQHISFDLIWGRCFKVCHLRTTNVRSLIVETEKGQVMLDGAKITPTGFTTTGSGVDPAVAEKAGRTLADLISDPNFIGPIKQQLVSYLSEPQLQNA